MAVGGFLGDVEKVFQQPRENWWLKWIWRFMISQFVVTVTAFILHLSLVTSWGLWTTALMLTWVLQVIQAGSAFVLLQEPRSTFRYFLFIISLGNTGLGIPAVFFAISEIAKCNRLSSEITNVMRNCWYQQGGSEAANLCIMEEDTITKHGTGVCPQVHFSAPGAAGVWSAWHLCVCAYILVVSAFYSVASLRVIAIDEYSERKREEQRQRERDATKIPISSDKSVLSHMRRTNAGQPR